MPGAADTDFFHKAEAEASVEYKEKSLYDPQEVARGGYDGLMEGTGKIVPGAKNKMQAAMGTVMPDTLVAANMEKHLQQSEKTGGRTDITHGKSAEERERISRSTGRPDGDYEGMKGIAIKADLPVCVNRIPG
jgi:uncharacterized protein